MRFNLMKGEALEELEWCADNSIDSVIADIPYGTTACKWDVVIPFDKMWEHLNRVCKPNGAIVLFGTEPFASKLRMSNLKNYKYDWVYVKAKSQNFLNAKKQPLRNNECICVFYRKQCTYNPIMTVGKPYIITRGPSRPSISSDQNILKGGYTMTNKGVRYPKSILPLLGVGTGLHETEKPVDLMKYLVNTYTNEGDTVLDFTMGSGTTGVAALELNRNFVGIELDNEYFKIANERIKGVVKSISKQKNQ